MKRWGLVDRREESGRVAIETDVRGIDSHDDGTSAARWKLTPSVRRWLAARQMPRRLTLAPEERTIVLDRADLAADAVRRLLQTILYQAMNDGMDAVEFELKPATEECAMRYFGPTERARRWWEVDCGDATVAAEAQAWPAWWDMHAPPAFVYLPMLRLVLAAVDGVAPEGARVPAGLNGRHWDLRLTVPAGWSFRLTGLDGYFEAEGGR